MSLFELCDDILELIEIELRPRLKYNQMVREYKDPRFHKSANRITKNRRDVHPGRHYLRVIYPTFEGFSSYRINRFVCQDINLHGMLIRTTVRHYGGAALPGHLHLPWPWPSAPANTPTRRHLPSSATVLRCH